jgi:hypothetical protein
VKRSAATWSYYGNTDPSLGGGTNFAVTENGGGSGTDSFDVQAVGHWTLTVKSAS